jgi:hypothetical protein
MVVSVAVHGMITITPIAVFKEIILRTFFTSRSHPYSNVTSYSALSPRRTIPVLIFEKEPADTNSFCHSQCHVD